MSKNVKETVGFYRDHYLCIDSKDTKIYGNFDSKEGRMIYLRLSYKCKVENECTEEENSKNLFKKGWIFLLANRIKFENKKYGSDAL